MTNQLLTYLMNKPIKSSVARSCIKSRHYANTCTDRIILSLFSLLALIVTLVNPLLIAAQEQRKDESFRVKMMFYIAETKDAEAETIIIRFAIDNKNRAYIATSDGTKMIDIDGYVYVRQFGRQWVVASKKTWEAMSINGDPPLEQLIKKGRVLPDSEIFNGNNMRLQGTATLHGRKTRVYASSKPGAITYDGSKLLVKTKEWISVADNRRRKMEGSILDADTNKIIGTFKVYFYAYNTNIVIKPPQLPKQPIDRFADILIFKWEPCDSVPNRPCQKNEITFSWDAQHIKNAIGVVLKREDVKHRNSITLGTFKQIKGSFKDVICEPSFYSLVAIDNKGRRIRYTKRVVAITADSLYKCE